MPGIRRRRAQRASAWLKEAIAEGVKMRAHQASKPRFPFSLGGAPAKAVPHQRECHARNGLYWRPAFAERVKKRPGNAVAPPINSRVSTGRPSVGPRANVPVLCRIARAGWAVASLERASPASFLLTGVNARRREIQYAVDLESRTRDKSR